MQMTAKDAGLVACRVCTRVSPAQATHCQLCGATLQSRDLYSLQKLWAFWITGLICYIPANLAPMLITNTLTGTQANTIIGGAVVLIDHGSWAVALVILAASVAIPVGKFIAVAYLAISVTRRARISAHARHQLFEVVEFIGRWSMIDVFVVAILSALIRLSTVAQVQPGPAALTFAASVIFTMLAASSFDSRLLWDKDREEEARNAAVTGTRPRPERERTPLV